MTSANTNTRRNGRNKIFKCQKRRIKWKIWFASSLGHQSSIFVSERNRKNRLIPEVVDMLRDAGYKVNYYHPFQDSNIGIVHGFWKIEWS